MRKMIDLIMQNYIRKFNKEIYKKNRVFNRELFNKKSYKRFNNKAFSIRPNKQMA